MIVDLLLLASVIWSEKLPLTSPRYVSVAVFGNQNETGFIVQWDKVESPNEFDPILGYKVTVWKEELARIFELKEDGTLQPVNIENAPKEVFDVSANFMYEIQRDGSLILPDVKKLWINIWRGKIKMVYVKKPDGSVERPPLDMKLALNLQHNEDVRVSEINVLSDKREVAYHAANSRYIYEVAVQAYTATDMGPYSNKHKIYP